MSYGTYFCGLCGIVVDDAAVRAIDEDPSSCFHLDCAAKIHRAYEATLARGPKARPLETTSWADRDARERLDTLEEEVRKIKSVWRLWLTDARRGSINHGTFDAMRTLLGMAHHE